MGLAVARLTARRLRRQPILRILMDGTAQSWLIEFKHLIYIIFIFLA